MVVQRQAQVGRATATMVWVAMALTLADVVAYLLIIRAQGGGPPDAFTIPFVAGYMVVMALLLWLSLLDRPRLVWLRPALRACAAAGLLVLGFFALFSIGLPIFVAGILASVSAVRALAGRNLKNAMLSEVAAGLVAVTALVGGFEVTQRIIVCPATGTMRGGGSGFLISSYHYKCVDGTLTMYPGDCNSGFQGFDANGHPIVGNGC